MLTIRAEQISVFKESSAHSFTKKVALHIKETFPEEYDEMGEENTKAFIQYGIKCAENYGINIDSFIIQYIDLMYLFGADFDENPEYPWASEILNDPDLESQEEVMDHLTEVANEVLENSEVSTV